MKNWVVVANAARARLLEETGQPGVFLERGDLVHVQSRSKGIELGTDRPGRIGTPGGGAGGADYPPRTDPREREHDRFAREVAAALDQAVAAGRCSSIVLVASDPFLGHIRAHLGTQAAKAVLRNVAHDYTTLGDADLARRLAPGAAAA